ncbi:MAG: amino acid adenylation domain-containing protein [Silvibacterium sp.]|nr:amino acid adenylation domain-containing protein [Silvibacterium sp.]
MSNLPQASFPLDDLQLAYWIGRRGVLEWGNVPTHFYIEFDGRVDPVRLETATRQALINQPMMRARFLDSAEQTILQDVPAFQLCIDDLTELTQAAAEQRLRATRDRMSHSTPIGDQTSPPFEILLSRLPGGQTRLHVNVDMLVFDLMSVRLLLDELGTVYDGRAVAPLASDFDFRKYIELERAAESDEPFKRSMRYWLGRSADLPPSPQLPLSLLPASQATRMPSMTPRRYRLSAIKWANLRERCAARGLTPSCVLGQAYAEVLERWSATSRMTLNLTQIRRSQHHASVKQMIGEFTNTILLGLDLSRGTTFVDRAMDFTERLWTDIAHSDVSGIRVLHEMSKAAGHPVMMPVVFTCALEDMRTPSQWAGNISYVICETSQVALDNMTITDGDALIILWNSIDEFFAPKIVEDMFEAYCRLLEQLAEGERVWEAPRPVQLPKRFQEQRRRINSATGSEPNQGELLHTLARTHLGEWADRPAVIAEQLTLSYGELFGAAAKLGGLLRGKGQVPERLVAIVMDKGWEQILSALAILEAGAAYLPIDASWPAERVHWLLENANVSLVLTQPGIDRRLGWPDRIERIVVDRSILEGARGYKPLTPLQSPSDLAYVIYTSGSTGRPKGVMIEHRSAVNTVIDINQRFEIGPNDRALALSNMSFDLSVYDVFGLLAVGGALVIPEPDAARDPKRWTEAIRSHKVTVWNSVPQLMQMFVEYHRGQQIKSMTPSIRVVFLSGDWIPISLLSSLEGVQTISLGGATEASIWSIFYRIDRVDPAWRSVPYGYPLRNQSWFVLDDALDEKPDWAAGKLYIGGVGLARGYWRDEEKTRSSFIVHPTTGERLYRTGDLGRYTADGTIEFLGRIDAQIKLHGYRVELGEIEYCACLHPAVGQCCVVVHDVKSKHQLAPTQKRNVEHRFLVGYVAPKPSTEPTEQSILSHLRTRLPEYMVPARIVLVGSLPLTANGKVDRGALPPIGKETTGASKFEGPNTPTEQVVTEVWSRILSCSAERIPSDANFFDLGGNSMMIVSVSNELAQELGCDVPLPQLFQRTTVRSLAAYLDDRRQSSITARPEARHPRLVATFERRRELIRRDRVE